MARFPRTLGDALAAQAEAARSTRTSVMGIDPLVSISIDLLDTALVNDLDQLSTDLVANSGAITELNSELGTMDDTMTNLTNEFGLMGSDLTSLQSDLALTNQELAAVSGEVDTKIADAISDYDAQPLTDDRFTDSSLTVWPFVNGAIPTGALAPGAIGESDIADFAIAVKKIKSDRHHIY